MVIYIEEKIVSDYKMRSR